MRSLIILLVAVHLGCGGVRAEPGEPARGPVLAELFTSQGCSSCPPADALLAELGQRSDVVALSFHVDYWNDLGWRDPFSSKAWSERQRAYRKRVYTPQLIVDGRVDVVGSRRGEVSRAIAAALRRDRAGRLRAKVTRSDGAVKIAATARGPDGEILVALYQRGATTRVPRGENAGKTLRNQRIVRALVRAGEVADGAGSGEVAIPIADDWPAELGVAVFVQDPASRAVHAVIDQPVR